MMAWPTELDVGFVCSTCNCKISDDEFSDHLVSCMSDLSAEERERVFVEERFHRAQYVTNYIVNESKLEHVSKSHGLKTQQTRAVLKALGHRVVDDGSVASSMGEPSSPSAGLNLQLAVSDVMQVDEPRPTLSDRAKVSGAELQAQLSDPDVQKEMAHMIEGNSSNIPRHQANPSYNLVMRFLIAFLHVVGGLQLSELHGVTIATVLGATMDDDGYIIPVGKGVRVSVAVYDIIKSYVKHRMGGPTSNFFLTWSGKAIADIHSEFSRFHTQLAGWLGKRAGTERNALRCSAQYQHILERFPVVCGKSAPTQKQLLDIGLTDKMEIKRHILNWRKDQTRLEVTNWVTSLKKSPNLEECEAKLSKICYLKMTPSSLQNLWVPKARRNVRFQDGIDTQTDVEQCLSTSGKGWPGLTVASDPIRGRGLVAHQSFQEG